MTVQGDVTHPGLNTVVCLVYVFTLFLARLTYKYHRLVHNSGDHPGELPGVEKCGVVDDDEEDEDEEVRLLFAYLYGFSFLPVILETLGHTSPIVGRPRVIFGRFRVIFGNLRKFSDGFR